MRNGLRLRPWEVRQVCPRLVRWQSPRQAPGETRWSLRTGCPPQGQLCRARWEGTHLSPDKAEATSSPRSLLPGAPGPAGSLVTP